MKRTLICAALAASLLAVHGTAAHAQMAVYDAASYAKLIDQATTAASQLRQLQNQVQQGQQLLTSLNQGSNVGGIAQILVFEETSIDGAVRAEERAAGTELAKQFAPNTLALAYVFEGGGFRAASARMVLSAIRLVSRSKYPNHRRICRILIGI